MTIATTDQHELDQLAHDMRAWRHQLHANPELGFEEHETAAFVAGKLRSWDIETHTGIGGTGVVGVIRGELGEGFRLGFRADMDALPMQEKTQAAHRSKKDGVFHGCGHDGHTSILLGLARYLSTRRAFRGTIHLIFQPAEELLTGGKTMIADGLFTRFPCDELYGLHNHPVLEPGKLGTRVGSMLAACDLFRITVHGIGGHAAAPHRAIDPIVVGSALVQSLQTIVSRSIGPMEAAAVSVCSFQAGTAINIISDTAVLEGTIRTLDRNVQATTLRRLREICDGTAQAHGCRIELDHLLTSPPTVNAAGPVATLLQAGRDVLGAENVVEDIAPILASEDFAFMAEQVPACYFFLGQGGHICHHPEFDFNDDVAIHGMRTMARVAELKLA
ncbi:MAG: amidohydrolase [Candidimonas sp.]